MIVPVFWWSAHRGDIIGRGYWNQAWLEAILGGDVWHPPADVSFQHIEADPSTKPFRASTSLLIIPGDHHAIPDDVAAINEFLSRLPSPTVVIVSNEECLLDVGQLTFPENSHLWVQSPHPTADYPPDTRYVGWWWRPGTLETLRDLPDGPRSDSWAFLGQANTLPRIDLAAALKERQATHQDGRLLVTDGFAQGVEQREYLAAYLSAYVAPAPSGPFSVDTFRLYESIEAGCLPIIEPHSPHDPHSRDTPAPDGYWDRVYPGHPLPVEEDWTDIDAVLERVYETPIQPRINQVGSWWQRVKRQTAYQLFDDLGIPDLRLPVTAVVLTSSIPAHPSLSVLTDTLDSIRQYPELADIDILILCDGIRPEQSDRAHDYDEYLRRLILACQSKQSPFANVLPLVHATHQHQARLVRSALPLIRTPLLLFIEHDTPLQDPIDWPGCVELLLHGDGYGQLDGRGELDVLRFHHEQRILPPHEHLMLDHGDPLDGPVPYLRTAQFSARPHLARVDYYTRILADHFLPHERWFIEDRMHSILQSAWWDKGFAGWLEHRLGIYAPHTPEIGGFQRSGHTDARGSDPKFELREGQ